MNEFIVIKGARQNNLKNIDVIIPRNKIDGKYLCPYCKFRAENTAELNYHLAFPMI